MHRMDVLRPTRSRKQTLLVRVAIAAVVIAGGGVALSRQKPAALPLDRSQAWIDTVRRGTLRIQVHGSGVLTPEDVQWIAASTDGRIERVSVLPGTAVEPSTVLLEIQNPELQQAAVDAE